MSEHYRDCPAGRHWGPRGAAGILPFVVASDGRAFVLLGLRSRAVQHAGTWSCFGGALDAGESPWDAAVRECAEEVAGIDPAHGVVAGEHVARCPHCGWSYTTYVVRVFGPGYVPEVTVARGRSAWETECVRWTWANKVAGHKRLHPGLAAAWPALLECIGCELRPWPEAG
jgi:8-oxo-dGTP diphosphatase